MQETEAQSLCREDPLEKGTAAHLSVLAWRVPWTQEPGGPWSIGLQRVEHNQSNLVYTHGVMWAGGENLGSSCCWWQHRMEKWFYCRSQVSTEKGSWQTIHQWYNYRDWHLIQKNIVTGCQEVFNRRLPVCCFGSVMNPLSFINSWIFRN